MAKELFTDLLLKASNAQASAYAPYSNFKVGCAILLANNNIVCGANIENASFPASICAERVALSQVIYQNLVSEVQAIALYADAETPIVPCGVCLQFLNEFITPKINIITKTPHAETKIFTFGELFPHGFQANNLKIMPIDP